MGAISDAKKKKQKHMGAMVIVMLNPMGETPYWFILLNYNKGWYIGTAQDC